MVNTTIIHVVDDDDAARESLMFLLEAESFIVRGYESAKLFLEASAAAEPGCIITDLQMPEIDGIELLRRLKESDRTWPVIVMTGQSDLPLANEAMRQGAVGFIEKPYDGDHLIRTVRETLAAQTSYSL